MSKPYRLGERNSATLPDKYKDSESYEQNRKRSAYWRSLRKHIQSGMLVGAKY